RETAVRDVDPARSECDGARVERLVTERLDAGHAAHDVEDRIESADLVEVDLFDRRAVDRRFCDRDATERLPRALLCTVRRVAAVDDLLDVPQVSVGMLVRQVEPDASTVDTASNGALRVHGDVAEA